MVRKACLLSDKEYAECFNAFKQISTEWEAMVEWLKDEFIPQVVGKKTVDILSIGSGTGDFDLSLIRLIREKIPGISYIAIDPNSEHNQIFLKKLNDSNINIKSFQIISKPFPEAEIEGNFDVIHLTHCLYYIQDRKKAISEAYKLLKPQGSLLIFHQTPLGINEIQRKFMKRVKDDEKEMFASRDIQTLFEELGTPFKFDVLVSDLDVTDCINGNKKGELLLNFFLESNLEGVDDSLKKEIISTLKESCQFKEERYLLFHPVGIFWVKKD